MGGYAVEPGELEWVDAVLVAGLAEARAATGRVFDEAEALFATGWHGPAASAFRLAWERWVEGATVMLGVLDELAGALAAAAAGYAGTDDAVRAGVARVAG